MGGAFLRIVTDSWTGYFSKGASSSGYTQKLQVVVLEPCKCKIKKKTTFDKNSRVRDDLLRK